MPISPNKENTGPLSPEKYIRTKARQLPIGKCFINESWEESGMCTVIVSRTHPKGNITSGIFLVDIFCLGLKDSIYNFNQSELEFEDILDQMGEREGILEIDYPLAHNIIYGAIDFADEYEFKPHKSFGLTQFILEDDTDEIEQLDVPFGVDEKPAVIIASENPQKKVIQHLEKVAGKGNFIVLNADEEEYEEEDDFEEEGDFEEEDSDDEESDILLDNYLDSSNEELLEEILEMGEDNLLDVLGQVYSLYIKLEGLDKYTELEEKTGNAFQELTIVEDYSDPSLKFLPKEQFERFFELQELLDENPEEAAKELEKTIAKYPHAVYSNLLFLAYIEQEKYEEASDYLEKALKDYSNDLTIRLNYAYILLEKKKFDTIKLFMSGFDITKFTSERTVFHLNEIAGFLNLACQYYGQANQLLLAAVYQGIFDSYTGIPPEIFSQKLNTFNWLCSLQWKDIRDNKLKDGKLG